MSHWNAGPEPGGCRTCPWQTSPMDRSPLPPRQPQPPPTVGLEATGPAPALGTVANLRWVGVEQMLVAAYGRPPKAGPSSPATWPHSHLAAIATVMPSSLQGLSSELDIQGCHLTGVTCHMTAPGPDPGLLPPPWPGVPQLPVWAIRVDLGLHFRTVQALRAAPRDRAGRVLGTMVNSRITDGGHRVHRSLQRGGVEGGDSVLRAPPSRLGPPWETWGCLLPPPVRTPACWSPDAGLASLCTQREGGQGAAGWAMDAGKKRSLAGEGHRPCPWR